MTKFNAILFSLILVATFSCSKNKKSEASNITNSTQMQLTIFHGYGDSEETVSESATIELVNQVMERLDWNKFTNVQLTIDDNNWLSVGGSLGSDGLSVIYSENGEQFVTVDPPETEEQMTKVLRSYLNDDGQFKKDWKFE